MGVITTVLESLVDVFRYVKLKRFGEEDNVQVFQAGAFGEDSNVPVEYKALYIKTANSSDPVCVGFINKLVVDDLAPGEKALFSTSEDGSEITSKIVQRNNGDIEINKELGDNAFIIIGIDGTIQLNGDADNLVGFTELKAGFDQCIADLNDTRAELNKITAALTSWVPAPQDGGAALKVAFSSDPSLNLPDSDTNIDASEKENLLSE